MDLKKVGKLIYELRKEKGMTQKQIADSLNLSDKTISKWERGIGFPDVSILNELSRVLEVNIEKLILGEIEKNEIDGGNMKKIKFYACQSCAGMLTGTGEAEVSCCGRKLEALNPQPENEEHKIDVEEIEDDYYITFNHEMKKEHFISFVAYSLYNKVFLVKLYPEQGAELRIPKMYGGTLYAFCSNHGIFAKKMPLPERQNKKNREAAL